MNRSHHPCRPQFSNHFQENNKHLIGRDNCLWNESIVTVMREREMSQSHTLRSSTTGALSLEATWLIQLKII